MHCSTVQVKMHSTLFSAALEKQAHNTEQWGSYSALTSVAVHCCCITAHLCGEHTSLGVTAVAQTCCDPNFPVVM